MQLCSLGLYFNEQKLSDRLLVNLFRRVRAAKQEDTSYYHLVRKLHVASFSEVGRAAMEELPGCSQPKTARSSRSTSPSRRSMAGRS